DPLAKCLRSEIALNSAPVANGNAARLFGDDYRYGVGLLGNPKSGAMTQSQASIERFTLAHWKNTCRGRDSSVANDYSAVVQRGLWMKDGQDELDGKISVDRDACFLVNAN